jgi:hypothetical protein
MNSETQRHGTTKENALPALGTVCGEAALCTNGEGIGKGRFNTHKAIALPNLNRLSSMSSIGSAHAGLVG